MTLFIGRSEKWRCQIVVAGIEHHL
jgi:hypothetical protein